MHALLTVICPVSARARQLNHRLKNRRTAIISRRENDVHFQSQSPDLRTMGLATSANNQVRSPPAGFVAVNSSKPRPTEAPAGENSSSPLMFSQSATDNVTIINGTSIKGASSTMRAELMKKFFTTADRQARAYDEFSGASDRQPSRQRARTSDAYPDYASISAGMVAIPGTPSSLLPPPKPHSSEKDDGGPFKAEMIVRIEELERGDRILPPCDRCRRLHMDCLKNLTACMGCTKKHAKCSWKDVRAEELQPHHFSEDEEPHHDEAHDGGRRTVLNESLMPPRAVDRQIPDSLHRYDEQDPERDRQHGRYDALDHERRLEPEREQERRKAGQRPTSYGEINHPRRLGNDSAADANRTQHSNHSPLARRRAVSENQPEDDVEQPDRRLFSRGRSEHGSTADDDASHRLAWAIMDTVEQVRERENELDKLE